MKKHRKIKHDISHKKKRKVNDFLQKYGVIILALLAGLIIGKFIMPMVMR